MRLPLSHQKRESALKMIKDWGCFIALLLMNTIKSYQFFIRILYCEVMKFGSHALLSRGWGTRKKRRVKSVTPTGVDHQTLF